MEYVEFVLWNGYLFGLFTVMFIKKIIMRIQIIEIYSFININEHIYR